MKVVVDLLLLSPLTLPELSRNINLRIHVTLEYLQQQQHQQHISSHYDMVRLHENTQRDIHLYVYYSLEETLTHTHRVMLLILLLMIMI